MRSKLTPKWSESRTSTTTNDGAACGVSIHDLRVGAVILIGLDMVVKMGVDGWMGVGR